MHFESQRSVLSGVTVSNNLVVTNAVVSEDLGTNRDLTVVTDNLTLGG